MRGHKELRWLDDELGGDELDGDAMSWANSR